jgi:hypothetical protein
MIRELELSVHDCVGILPSSWEKTTIFGGIFTGPQILLVKGGRNSLAWQMLMEELAIGSIHIDKIRLVTELEFN